MRVKELENCGNASFGTERDRGGRPGRLRAREVKTTVKTRHFLMRAWQIEARIEGWIAERDRLYELLKRAGGARGEAEDPPRREAEEAMAALDAQIERQIIALCRVKREVNDAIGAVEDARSRYLLEMRYRDYLTWDAIADALECEPRHVYRLHRRALKSLEDSMDRGDAASSAR